MKPTEINIRKSNNYSAPIPPLGRVTSILSTIHYLYECSNFNSERNELVSLLNDILFMNDMENFPVHEKANTLLYGHDSLLFDENRMILKGTIKFIRKSGRFSKNDD